MLERGGRINMMGNTITMAMVLQNFGLIRSKEKYTVTFGNNYGGLSVLAAGCAVPPPKSIFSPFGIDLTAEAEEAGKDTKVQTMPDNLVGKANLRLMEAANTAGYNWGKVENFIDPKNALRDVRTVCWGALKAPNFRQGTMGTKRYNMAQTLRFIRRLRT